MNQNMKHIESALRKITGNSNLEVKNNSKILLDFNLESIDFVDLIFEVERESGKRIDLTDLSVALIKKNNVNFKEIRVEDLNQYLNELK